MAHVADTPASTQSYQLHTRSRSHHDPHASFSTWQYDGLGREDSRHDAQTQFRGATRVARWHEERVQRLQYQGNNTWITPGESSVVGDRVHGSLCSTWADEGTAIHGDNGHTKNISPSSNGTTGQDSSDAVRASTCSMNYTGVSKRPQSTNFRQSHEDDPAHDVLRQRPQSASSLRQPQKDLSLHGAGGTERQAMKLAVSYSNSVHNGKVHPKQFTSQKHTLSSKVLSSGFGSIGKNREDPQDATQSSFTTENWKDINTMVRLAPPTTDQVETDVVACGSGLHVARSNKLQRESPSRRMNTTKVVPGMAPALERERALSCGRQQTGAKREATHLQEHERNELINRTRARSRQVKAASSVPKLPTQHNKSSSSLPGVSRTFETTRSELGGRRAVAEGRARVYIEMGWFADFGLRKPHEASANSSIAATPNAPKKARIKARKKAKEKTSDVNEDRKDSKQAKAVASDIVCKHEPTDPTDEHESKRDRLMATTRAGNNGNSDARSQGTHSGSHEQVSLVHEGQPKPGIATECLLGMKNENWLFAECATVGDCHTKDVPSLPMAGDIRLGPGCNSAATKERDSSQPAYFPANGRSCSTLENDTPSRVYALDDFIVLDWLRENTEHRDASTIRFGENSDTEQASCYFDQPPNRLDSSPPLLDLNGISDQPGSCTWRSDNTSDPPDSHLSDIYDLCTAIDGLGNGSLDGLARVGTTQSHDVPQSYGQLCESTDHIFKIKLPPIVSGSDRNSLVELCVCGMTANETGDALVVDAPPFVINNASPTATASDGMDHLECHTKRNLSAMEVAELQQIAPPTVVDTPSAVTISSEEIVIEGEARLDNSFSQSCELKEGGGSTNDSDHTDQLMTSLDICELQKQNHDDCGNRTVSGAVVYSDADRGINNMGDAEVCEVEGLSASNDEGKPTAISAQMEESYEIGHSWLLAKLEDLKIESEHLGILAIKGDDTIERAANEGQSLLDDEAVDLLTSAKAGPWPASAINTLTKEGNATPSLSESMQGALDKVIGAGITDEDSPVVNAAALTVNLEVTDSLQAIGDDTKVDHKPKSSYNDESYSEDDDDEYEVIDSDEDGTNDARSEANAMPVDEEVDEDERQCVKTTTCPEKDGNINDSFACSVEIACETEKSNETGEVSEWTNGMVAVSTEKNTTIGVVDICDSQTAEGEPVKAPSTQNGPAMTITGDNNFSSDALLDEGNAENLAARSDQGRCLREEDTSLLEEDHLIATLTSTESDDIESLETIGVDGIDRFGTEDRENMQSELKPSIQLVGQIVTSIEGHAIAKPFKGKEDNTGTENLTIEIMAEIDCIHKEETAAFQRAEVQNESEGRNAMGSDVWESIEEAHAPLPGGACAKQEIDFEYHGAGESEEVIPMSATENVAFNCEAPTKQDDDYENDFFLNDGLSSRTSLDKCSESDQMELCYGIATTATELKYAAVCGPIHDPRYITLAEVYANTNNFVAGDCIHSEKDADSDSCGRDTQCIMETGTTTNENRIEPEEIDVNFAGLATKLSGCSNSISDVGEILVTSPLPSIGEKHDVLHTDSANLYDGCGYPAASTCISLAHNASTDAAVTPGLPGANIVSSEGICTTSFTSSAPSENVPGSPYALNITEPLSSSAAITTCGTLDSFDSIQLGTVSTYDDPVLCVELHSPLTGVYQGGSRKESPIVAPDVILRHSTSPRNSETGDVNEEVGFASGDHVASPRCRTWVENVGHVYKENIITESVRDLTTSVPSESDEMTRDFAHIVCADTIENYKGSGGREDSGAYHIQAWYRAFSSSTSNDQCECSGAKHERPLLKGTEASVSFNGLATKASIEDELFENGSLPHACTRRVFDDGAKEAFKTTLPFATSTICIKGEDQSGNESRNDAPSLTLTGDFGNGSPTCYLSNDGAARDDPPFHVLEISARDFITDHGSGGDAHLVIEYHSDSLLEATEILSTKAAVHVHRPELETANSNDLTGLTDEREDGSDHDENCQGSHGEDDEPIPEDIGTPLVCEKIDALQQSPVGVELTPDEAIISTVSAKLTERWTKKVSSSDLMEEVTQEPRTFERSNETVQQIGLDADLDDDYASSFSQESGHEEDLQAVVGAQKDFLSPTNMEVVNPLPLLHSEECSTNDLCNQQLRSVNVVEPGHMICEHQSDTAKGDSESNATLCETTTLETRTKFGDDILEVCDGRSEGDALHRIQHWCRSNYLRHHPATKRGEEMEEQSSFTKPGLGGLSGEQAATGSVVCDDPVLGVATISRLDRTMAITSETNLQIDDYAASIQESVPSPESDFDSGQLHMPSDLGDGGAVDMQLAVGGGVVFESISESVPVEVCQHEQLNTVVCGRDVSEGCEQFPRHNGPLGMKEQAANAAALRIQWQFRCFVSRRILLDQMRFMIRKRRRESRRLTRRTSATSIVAGVDHTVASESSQQSVHGDTQAAPKSHGILPGNCELTGDSAKVIGIVTPRGSLSAPMVHFFGSELVDIDDKTAESISFATNAIVSSKHTLERDNTSSNNPHLIAPQTKTETEETSSILKSVDNSADVISTLAGIDEDGMLADVPLGREDGRFISNEENTEIDANDKQIATSHRSEHWERYLDSNSNKSFYYSPQHRESQWNRPLGAPVVDMAVEESPALAVSQERQGETANTTAAEDPREATRDLTTWHSIRVNATLLESNGGWDRYLALEGAEIFYYHSERQQYVQERLYAGSTDGGIPQEFTEAKNRLLQPSTLDDTPAATVTSTTRDEKHSGSDLQWKLRRNQSLRAAKRGDWQAFVDPATHQTFYYNAVSGECTWEIPAAFQHPHSVPPPTTYISNEWVQYIDSDTSQPYYVNLATHETTWQKPDDFDSASSSTDLTRIHRITEIAEVAPSTVFSADDEEERSEEEGEYVISIHDERDEQTEQGAYENMDQLGV